MVYCPASCTCYLQPNAAWRPPRQLQDGVQRRIIHPTGALSIDPPEVGRWQVSAAVRPAFEDYARGPRADGRRWIDAPRLRRSRVASWGWDYLVVLAWLALVFVVVGLPQLVGWIDLAWVWSRPVAADVAVTLLTVVPYLAYLTLTEAGPARATWGKRRMGLALHDPEGSITFGQVLARNTVKVLPWQFGHMSAMRFAVGDGSMGFAVLLFVASMVLLAAVVLPVLVGRIGLHDRVAGTTVDWTLATLKG